MTWEEIFLCDLTSSSMKDKFKEEYDWIQRPKRKQEEKFGETFMRQLQKFEY